MKQAFVLLAWLCLPALCHGQKVLTEQEQPLYHVNDHILIDKFYREHVPLDGARVQYIPCRKDELYGFMDKTTKQWKIQPKYEQVIAVYPEGAIVGTDDRYGLLSYTDTFIIPPYFSNLYKEGNIYHALFHNHDTAIKPEYLSGCIGNYYFNEQGKYLFSARAHAQQSFTALDSMAWFRYADTFKVYGRSGKLLKTIPYSRSKLFVGTFNNCLVYRVSSSTFTGYHWYGLSGKLLHTLPILQEGGIQGIYRLNDTMYALMSDEDGIRFINNRRMFYPFGVQNGMVFAGTGRMYTNLVDEWLAGNTAIPVTDARTGLCGLLAGDGALKVPCRYAWIGDMENGEAPYIDTGTKKMGFINANGQITVPPVLGAENATSENRMIEPLRYSEGLAAVARGRRPRTGSDRMFSYYCGYADHTGKIALALPDSVVFAASFSGGLAAVVSESKNVGFIDKKGTLAIPYKYELAVVGAYPFPQVVVPQFINGFAYIKAFKGYIDSTGYEYFSGKRMMDEYNFSH